jgi:hypothetical protein
MPAKNVPCSYCGTPYSLRRLRCPKCHLDREERSTPATFNDRLAGLVLLGLGGLMAAGLGWYIYKTRFARQAVLFVVPLWLLLHGALLLAGIHLRDFYSWWNRLAQPARLGIQVLAWATFLALVWFLIAAGR